jgi:hypothetical protein
MKIECVMCGTRREARGVHGSDTGECPSCGYLGWTEAGAIGPYERELVRNQISEFVRGVPSSPASLRTRSARPDFRLS